MLGSQSNLAKLLGLAPTVVNQWVKGIRPVPAIYCSSIEKETGVSRKLLRPNDYSKIWPELSESDSTFAD